MSNQVKLETSGRYVKLTQREREIIDRLCEEELDQMRDDVEIDVGYAQELRIITGKVRQASISQTDQERKP